FSFFFFHVTATSEIYTLSLHYALPIFELDQRRVAVLRDEPVLVRVEWILDVAHVLQVGDRLHDAGDRRRERVAVHRLGLRLDERSEEHTSELQSRSDLVCRLLLEKKKK